MAYFVTFLVILTASCATALPWGELPDLTPSALSLKMFGETVTLIRSQFGELSDWILAKTPRSFYQNYTRVYCTLRGFISTSDRQKKSFISRSRIPLWSTKDPKKMGTILSYFPGAQGRSFPNFFSRQNSWDPLRISYPSPDLSPISVGFHDPSLKHHQKVHSHPQPYPKETWRRRRRSAEAQHLPSSFSELFTLRGAPFFTDEDFDIENARVNEEGPILDDAGARPQRSPEPQQSVPTILGPQNFFGPRPVRGSERPPPVYPPQDHFNQHGDLFQLPPSSPGFALPLVHEDPHFQADYHAVKFQPPVTRKKKEVKSKDLGFGGFEGLGGFTSGPNGFGVESFQSSLQDARSILGFGPFGAFGGHFEPDPAFAESVPQASAHDSFGPAPPLNVGRFESTFLDDTNRGFDPFGVMERINDASKRFLPF